MKGLHPFATPFGPVQAAFDPEGALIYLGFADHEYRHRLVSRLGGWGAQEAAPPALARLRDQLEDYAAGLRTAFDLPVRLLGTPFERRVWAALQRIPFGETRSYGQLAAALGDAHLARAVGRANGANPVSILVPCHRVIGAGGALTGYAGGLARKERLLRLEGAVSGPVLLPAGSR